MQDGDGMAGAPMGAQQESFDRVPLSNWSGNLQLALEGNALTIRSVCNAYPFNLIWIVMLIAITVENFREGSSDLNSFGDVAVTAILGLGGLFMLFVWSIDTKFDSSRATIVRSYLFFAWVWWRRLYAFDQFSGVLLTPGEDENDRFLIYLVKKTERRMRLACRGEPKPVCDLAVEAIQAITGLPTIAET